MQDRRHVTDDLLEIEVVASTGPWMLTDTLKEYVQFERQAAGEYHLETQEPTRPHDLRRHQFNEVWQWPARP